LVWQFLQYELHILFLIIISNLLSISFPLD
jgi:hypothetical protein